jgi:hypothetical protein
VLSPGTIRRALLRLGMNWRRAGHRLTGPDPAYAPQKTAATG